jgi:integrase
MGVKLRERESGNKILFYLDIYHNGKRRTEYLTGVYLIAKPAKGRLSKEENEHNKGNRSLAEDIRYKREKELLNGTYNIEDRSRADGSFLEFFKKLMETKRESIGNYGNWHSTKLHLDGYCEGGDVSFKQIDKEWLQGFKDYLQNAARTKSKQKLLPNTLTSYFSKVKAALKEAYKDGIISKNLADMVDGFKPAETERNFLTKEELEAASKADCEIPVIKTSFLFGCLTGLRYSDLEKLTWREVHHSDEMGYFLRFRMKKTKSYETLYISDQAYSLLGERRDPEEKVFVGLKYSAWHNVKLQQWMFNAGVHKTITFHCSRHTYATLQITFGTDVYTLQSMLGHKNIKNTQIYAKIMDQRKREAGSKINVNL